MDKLVLFNNTNRNKLLNKRSGESKFGQHVQILTSISNIYEQLKNLDVTHVILGLPEDVGVFANHGKTGASKAWEATLKVLLNIHSNEFTRANKVLILGHLDFTEEQLLVSKLNPSRKKDILKAKKKKSKKNDNKKLNKPMRDSSGGKAYKVYVKDPKTGNIKTIRFGSGGLKAKINNKTARNAYAARHKCSTRNDKTKASYWSCRLPRYAKLLGLKSNFGGFW